MAKHNVLGEKGEDMACDYLRQKGYRIAERNWRHGRAEIDIIAWHEDTLIFVEVKTRSSEHFASPEEAVTPKKEALLISAGQAYMQHINYEWAIRYDIISVIMPDNKTASIQHFENAFFSAY